MIPFVAAQAVASRQAKQKQIKSRPGHTDAHPQSRTSSKGIFRRVLDALVQSRLRKADLATEAHCRLNGVERPQ